MLAALSHNQPQWKSKVRDILHGSNDQTLKSEKMVPKAGFRNQFLHQICELGVELVPALCAHYFCVIFVSFLWWRVGGTPGGTLVKFGKNIIPATSTTKVHGKMKQVCMEASAQTSKMVFRLHETTVSMNAPNVQK